MILLLGKIDWLDGSMVGRLVTYLGHNKRIGTWFQWWRQPIATEFWWINRFGDIYLKDRDDRKTFGR
jgi:hypothetical protein